MNINYSQINKKGQSLVEVVVACGIIGVVLVAMMSMVMASKNLLYASEDQTKATALAQEAIEIVMHQRDIGCSFSNITKADGSLKTGPFVIKGDTEGSNDETLLNTGTPETIPNFDGFARLIYIEELSSSPNITGIDTSSFNNKPAQCINSDQDYDCVTSYYAIMVDIHKGGSSGPIISQVKTIISK